MAKNYVGITDTGKQRTNNEDTFIAETLPKPFITACVIDGLGGYEGGEVAAALAREAIVNTLSKGADDIITLLKQSIIYASQSIQEAKKNTANENYNHMACVVTLALADITSNKFYYAHVGDTRLYLLRDKSLIKITKDQSFVGFLEDNGRLTEEEAMQHPKRNEINKALGFDMAVDAADYIETGESPFLPGDMLLVCSDGLTDMINSQAMAAILNNNQTLQQKAEALVQSANDAGGSDNITVVLVQNDKKQLRQEAIKPASQKIDPGYPNETLNQEGSDQIFPVEKKGRKGTIAVPVLSALLVLSIAALIWMFLKSREPVTQQKPAGYVIPEVNNRNAGERALMDSINKPLTQSLVIKTDSASKQVTISDTIFISKDSLVIYGNGAVLQPASSFKGPAFVLSDNCNYIVFDSLSFQNFDAAIWAKQTGIHLRKVRFVNCVVPVVQVKPGS